MKGRKKKSKWWSKPLINQHQIVLYVSTRLELKSTKLNILKLTKCKVERRNQSGGLTFDKTTPDSVVCKFVNMHNAWNLF
jgi:hypothetical protein